jgi:hypothetical protein
MENSKGLTFAYSPNSFGKSHVDYWDAVFHVLKNEFPSIQFYGLKAIDENHESILIVSIDEVLGEDVFLSPRGAIITFDGLITEKQIEQSRSIFNKSLLGFIDVSQPALLHVPWFKRIVFESKVLGTGAEVGAGQVHLGKILEQSLIELQRVKKIHEKVVPLRHEKIKGINLYSKFAAGFSSGGEFFDIKKDEHQVIVIVTHAKSYVASSIVLNHFEEFQRIKNVDKESIEDFLENLIDECRELDLIDRDNPETLQLDILRLDLRTFEFEGFHFGHGSYFSNGKKLSNENERALNENFFEEAHYKGKLERGEKLIYASPGVLQNFEVRGEKGLLGKIVLEQFDNGPREVLNEIFFQLKKNNEEDFLKFDASVIYLEVDANAFIQV